MSRRPDVQARHRRQRESTRKRILDAAMELLEERPWHEIQLEAIMARAGLTRTAFYRHFADRQALLLALLDDLGLTLRRVPEAWQRGAEDPRTELRDALAELVATYVRHGRLLAAVAEAASHDEQVRSQYLCLADALIAAVARRIEADVEAGRSAIADPLEVARALVWMNERYLLDRFARQRSDEPARAAAALAEIWLGALYGSPRRT